MNKTLHHRPMRPRRWLAPLATGLCALALIPLPTERKAPGEVDVPVQIEGRWVRPGDWLYADADGIVLTEGPA